MFLSIVEEARTEALLETEGKTVTYVSPNSGSNDWVQFGKPKEKRSLSSVILRKGAKEKIVLDAEEFIKNSQWYKEREIPYRRGYLLYGPPGVVRFPVFIYFCRLIQLYLIKYSILIDYAKYSFRLWKDIFH